MLAGRRLSAPFSPLARRSYPGHTVVTYINCSAGVKALSDVIVTSSSAEVILRQIPDPDRLRPGPEPRSLGREAAGRKFVVWPGTCVVHETFSEKRILELLAAHPGARLIAHPECDEVVLRHASFVGSTSALLKHVTTSDHRRSSWRPRKGSSTRCTVPRRARS